MFWWFIVDDRHRFAYYFDSLSMTGSLEPLVHSEPIQQHKSMDLDMCGSIIGWIIVPIHAHITDHLHTDRTMCI